MRSGPFRFSAGCGSSALGKLCDASWVGLQRQSVPPVDVSFKFHFVRSFHSGKEVCEARRHAPEEGSEGRVVFGPPFLSCTREAAQSSSAEQAAGGTSEAQDGAKEKAAQLQSPRHAQTLGPPGICPILRLDGEYLQSRRSAAVESSNFLPPGTVTTAAVGCSSLHLAEVAGLGPGHSRPQRGHPRLGRTRTSVSGHARPGHAAPARRSRWETGRRPQCGFHTNPPAAQLTRPLSSFFPTRYFISSKMHIFHILTF